MPFCDDGGNFLLSGETIDASGRTPAATGVSAHPVLVLPGWYVVPKGIGPVTVVNHKQVGSAILRRPQGVLTGEQVDLIARQIDARCRDVED